MDMKLRPSIFKRFIALLIDFVLLGITGYILGLFFEDFFVSLENYGTLIGSVICILYFGILNSSIGKGRTLGKIIINSKVVGLDSNYLSFGKASLRAFIAFFPLLNVELFNEGRWMMLILLIVMLVVFANIYFLFVNKDRRCLHDILTGSIVLYKPVDSFTIDEHNDVSRKKLIGVGVVALLFMIMGVYMTFSSTYGIGELLTAKEAIEKEPGVISVNKVNLSTTTNSSTNGPTETYTSINITVRINKESEVNNVDSKYFDDFLKIIRENIKEAGSVNYIKITLYYGYNIGIANKNRSMTKTYEQ